MHELGIYHGQQDEKVERPNPDKADEDEARLQECGAGAQQKRLRRHGDRHAEQDGEHQMNGHADGCAHGRGGDRAGEGGRYPSGHGRSLGIPEAGIEQNPRDLRHTTGEAREGAQPESAGVEAQ